jgi:site-specific DNA-methyltransferase (adenine-specific)
VYYDKNGITLHNGDCLDVLATMPPESVDSIVTDPPYGLAFMGRRWDYDVPAVAIWEQCLRVLKPGGYLLAFAGTRTQHRMAVRIEDAGFEIRDMIAWVYGSGFPKSLDVSKAIDKGEGENKARQLRFTEWMRSTGITAQQIAEATGTSMASHYLTAGSQPAIATADLFDKMRPYLPEVPEEIEQLVAERTGIEWIAYKNREVVGQGSSAISTRKELQHDRGTVWGANSSTFDITAPATEAAKQWQGWGTALKPALEPITVARKPLRGTVAANVLQYGTGGLNVDGCRVGTDGGTSGCSAGPSRGILGDGLNGAFGRPVPGLGRWPANLIHDGSDEVAGLFPEDGDASAARFFYCAKAGPDERRDSKHPTVKPVALMRYLVRLVTPIGATVLDPFCGSGTTLEAAMLESCKAIGVELNPEYCADAVERLRQGVLF